MENEKRLIDANALKALFDERYDDAFMQAHTRPNIAHWEGYSIGVNWGCNTIADAPTVDAVEVVRCKDCKHWSGLVLGMRCKYHSFPPNSWIYKQEDDFCSKGERRTDGQS